jgi:hypothetical protein
MSADKPQNAEEDKLIELTNTQIQVGTTQQQQQEDENLKLTQAVRVQPVKISIMFLIPGILSLAFSITSNSQVLAFIGLGLTFWGALFLFVRPLRYVEGSLLDSTSISAYTTIDRAVKDLKAKGKGYYIPPYPEQAYVPEHLKGLKDMVAFISTDSDSVTPSIEEIAKGKFLLGNPKGICLSPPGVGLLARFEKQLKTEFTRLELAELCESLSHLIPEDLQLAKEIEMRPEEELIYLKVTDSVYKQLYTEKDLRSVHLLGCPLVSAVACAIAKTTGKVVTIQKDKLSPDAETIEVWFRTVQG